MDGNSSHELNIGVVMAKKFQPRAPRMPAIVCETLMLSSHKLPALPTGGHASDPLGRLSLLSTCFIFTLAGIRTPEPYTLELAS